MNNYLLIKCRFFYAFICKATRMKDKTGFYFKRKYAIILCRISMRINRKEEYYEIFI